MAEISMCRKYQASEKVFIVFCMLPSTHPFNLRRLSCLKIFLVALQLNMPGIDVYQY